jgi:predicted MPP superfamily phosphohydrolase
MKQQHVYHILHLSDLHLHPDTDPTVIDSFCDKLAEIKNTLGSKFDFGFITGDVFNGGTGIPNSKEKKKSLYKNPSFFINQSYVPKINDVENKKAIELLDAINSSSKMRFVAYGNHDMKVALDKDTDKIYCTYSDECTHEIHDKNYKEYSKYIIDKLGDSNNIADIEKDIFYNLSDLFDANRRLELFNKIDLAYTTGVFYDKENAPNIAVVILNSAWLNVDSKKCHGQLIIGNEILDSIINALIDKDIIDGNGKSQPGKYVITLLHNDFNWHSVIDHHKPYNTKTGDSTTVLKESVIRKISNFSDLILCGHEHAETKPTLLDLNSYLFKVGGTFKKEGEGKYTFSVITLNFTFNTLTRFKYVHNGREFSIDETQSDSIITTELKPLDAERSFNKPRRTVENMFQIIKKNQLTNKYHIDLAICQTYEDYLRIRSKK